MAAAVSDKVTSDNAFIRQVQTSPLLSYQRAMAMDTHRYVIVEKSRRIGATWVRACMAVNRCLTLKDDHWFCSADATATKEFIEYIKLFAQVANIVANTEFINLDGSSTECVRFPNGSKVVALSSRPQALRSKGGSVTLDEFAHVEHAAALYMAAQPVIANGGNLWVISSHNGRGTEFYKLCEAVKAGSKKGWGHHRITIHNAVAAGLSIKFKGEHLALLPDLDACNAAFIDFLRQGCLSDYHWQQEYMCEVGESVGIIGDSDYSACLLPAMEPTSELNPMAAYGPLYAGFDPARANDGDLSALWAVEHGDDPTALSSQRDVYRTVMQRSFRGMPFAAQVQYVAGILSHPRLMKMVVEANGIGAMLAEELFKMFPSKVVIVHASNPLKAEVCERVGRFVAQHRVSLPSDNSVRADLLAMRRVEGQRGGLRYEGTSPDSHCDRFMALAYALHAAETQRVGFSFASNRVVKVVATETTETTETNNQKVTNDLVPAVQVKAFSIPAVRGRGKYVGT